MIHQKHQQGYSLIELLIAMSIFTIGVATVIFLVLDAGVTSTQGGERTQAILLAQEGLEAVRSIRDSDFESLGNGTHGLVLQNGKWIFQNTFDINGQFTRTLSVINTTIGASVSGGSSGGIDGGNGLGSIDVCKIVIDSNKNQNTGSGYADSFRIVLRKPDNQTWTVTFNTPLIATTDILSDAPGLDAACVQNIDLPYGQYSYNVESIVNGGSNWQTPKYNDQYTEAISTVNDFYTYNTNLDANGLIDVLASRPGRALVVLNQLTPAATALANSLLVKEVTSTVTWPVTPTRSESVQFTEYLSDWDRDEIDGLFVDISGARIESGTSNRNVRGILIGNTSGKSIVLDKIILTWTKPASFFYRASIAGTQVFQGNTSTGATLDITNRTLTPGVMNVEITQLRWTQSILGTPIGIKFIMVDGSSEQFTIPSF